MPGSLQVVRLSNNALTGPFPDAPQLPTNLIILDLSHNLLTGTLPNALPAKLAAINVTDNHLKGTLPDTWEVALAEVRLDNNDFSGKLPVSWSAWGRTSSNSIQLSLLNAQMHGSMPQQWVQQFCLAIVRNLSTQMLFTPTSTQIFVYEGVYGSVCFPVFFGEPIAVTAQHANINVTLNGKTYSFDYNNPESLCSIPHAARNAGILWGVFGATLACTIVGCKVYLLRKPKDPSPGKLTVIRAAASSALDHKKVQMPRDIAIIVWIFASDIVWYIYSQVTDGITIHQVFSSGQLKYAYWLLAILLLPSACIFLLVARVSVKHRLSRVDRGPLQSRSRSMMHQAGAVLASILISPVLFVAIQLDLLLQCFGFSVSKVFRLADFSLSSLYRTQSVFEAYFNAFPQAVLQTKLYLMGKDPNGIHVYINTTLYVYSVVGFLASVLKTVAFMIIEVHQSKCGFWVYLKQLVYFLPFGDDQQTQAVDMGRTMSGTVLLTHNPSGTLKV